ncbi:MAG: hypothetical protein LBJ20_04660, partial [Candidatus Methanoplasma sp.]|nr:hypothetical protein [Candidatus Methanoplasma sp.]
ASKIKYTVTLTAGTGISGFEYSINGEDAVDYEEPFQTEHGDTLSVTALLTEGYEFKEWTDSEDNPLVIPSVTGAVSVTASASLKQYTVTFDSGPNYTVHAKDGYSLSSLTAEYGSSLLFGIRVSEGYSAYPVLSGNANIILQTDGWYRISDIRSDIRISITVNAVSGEGSYSDGIGSGNGTGNGPGNTGGNNSTGDGTGGSGSDADSGRSTYYWAPAIIVTAFLGSVAAVAIAKFGLFGIKIFGK